MSGGCSPMITVKNNIFSLLSDDSKNEVNNFIEFLYNKEKSETVKAVEDALQGNNLAGPFTSVSDFIRDLHEND